MEKDKADIKSVTSFRLKSLVRDKILYMAWYERENITDIVNKVLESEIAKFEKKNGVITDEQIKKARDRRK